MIRWPLTKKMIVGIVLLVSAVYSAKLFSLILSAKQTSLRLLFFEFFSKPAMLIWTHSLPRRL